jgi:hypothetical protein
MLANRGPKLVPGTRCETGARNRCQALGAEPGRMLANRGPNRCQAPGAEPGRMLSNRGPKLVPGTRCGARPSYASRGQSPSFSVPEFLACTGAGVPTRRTFRRSSSRASSGIVGFRLPMATRKRPGRTTSANEFRSESGSPGAKSVPCPMA